MSIAIHCDTCDAWGRGTMTLGFLTVHWDRQSLHFCSWDCIILYGSRQEPITTLEAR